MKIITLNKPGELQLSNKEYNLKPKANEALVKVHSIGICGTDIHAFKGRQPFFSYPRILGHELGVEVVETGKDVSNVKIGDKCAVEPYFNKTKGQAVKRGKSNCGESISVFGVHEEGGMREYFVIDASYLHPSQKLNFDQLALIEPMAIGYHATQRARIQKEDKVLVIGAGPIGLSTAQFATLDCDQVVVMDINEKRLELCQANLPLKDILHVDKTEFDYVGKLQGVFDGDLPTVILDATGNPSSMKNTLEYAAHGASIVFIGLFQGDFSFYDPLFHKKEISLMASRNALAADFKAIIRLIESGDIKTDFWISHRVDFTFLSKSFERLFFGENQIVKVMVTP